MDDILKHLNDKYVEFNKSLFDNKLPRIPIQWANLKHAGALVSYKVINHGGKKYYYDGSMVMKISSKYKRTKEQLEPLLLHEMIHVYEVIIERDVTSNHGAFFLKMRRVLSAISGIDIPLTDNTSGLELSNKEIKPLALLAIIFDDGRKAYALMSVTTAHNKINDIHKYWSQTRNRHVKLLIVKSPLWMEKAARIPLQRAINKLKLFTLSDNDYNDAMNNSEILWVNKQIDE